MAETRRMRPLLGTFVEIGADGCGAQVDTAISCAFAEIARLHDLLSFQRPDSELSRLNAAAGEWVSMSATSLRVLRLARAITCMSGHLFNCTVGGALVAQGVLPDHDSAPFLAYGDGADIDISSVGARLKRPLRITLDGIAKGYAVDLAVAALKRQGIAHGWINAGGDLRVFGELVLPVTQRPASGSINLLGGLRQAAIATSRAGGDVSPSFPGVIVRGTAPLPDAVVTSAPAVFSVIARYAWRADALTKVAALAPLAERAQCVAALGGVLVGDTHSCVA